MFNQSNGAFVKKLLCILLAVVLTLSFVGCQPKEVIYTQYPLSRNGIPLHLDCVSADAPERNILLIHGLTYSSHEFDLDYQDYSLVRFLARNGYAVWRLDITGYGQSGLPADGFVPDSAYAAEDIHAAVDEIIAQTGAETIDLLGWSWGTVTSSLFVGAHPEKVGRLVLYAPILSGLGDMEITEDYHTNDWRHAASDFQMTEEGDYDLSVTEKEVIEIYCSNCWRYDGAQSPNGGRRDLCVSEETTLIDLPSIQVPTLVICGDRDPYLDDTRIHSVLEDLPPQSELKIIPGASHAMLMEKPYYKTFRECILAFLDPA